MNRNMENQRSESILYQRNHGQIPFPENVMESVPVGESNKEIPSSEMKCDFSGYGLTNFGVTETLEMPEDVISDPDVFSFILSKKTWDEKLTDAQKDHLMKLLPANVSTSNETAEAFLTTFFDAPRTPLFFTHPLVDFQQKLAGGFYDAACSNEVRQLKACARLHYEHRIREYHGRMLKKVLVYRRKLLEAAAAVPEGEAFTYDWKTDFVDNLHRERNHSYGNGEESPSPAWRRALKRSRMMIMDCKTRAGDPQTLSSDDEDFAPVTSASKGGANGHGGSGGSSVQSGHHRQVNQLMHDAGHRSNSPVRSTLAKPNRMDLDLHEPVGTIEIKDMLKDFRRLRRTHPEHPSLEFDDTELDDVVDRCGSEIRLMAQKWGVYTKPVPTLDPAEPSNPTSIFFPTVSASHRKLPSAKGQAKNAPPPKEKDK